MNSPEHVGLFLTASLSLAPGLLSSIADAKYAMLVTAWPPQAGLVGAWSYAHSHLVLVRQRQAHMFPDPMEAEEEMSKTMREIELRIHGTGEASCNL